jgi:hypothetical protein
MGVQAAYERLQAGAAGGQGPQPWRIRLILQASWLRRPALRLQPRPAWVGRATAAAPACICESSPRGPTSPHCWLEVPARLLAPHVYSVLSDHRLLASPVSQPPQAQCLLFRRCPEVLAPFKYAGFPLLLQAVALPQQDGEHGGPSAEHFLSPEAAPQLQVGGPACLAWGRSGLGHR